MQVLADNGGYVLAEEGSRLLFFRRRILPTWLPFVLGLLPAILAINAVVLAATGYPAVAAILFVIAAATGGALVAVLRSRRRTLAEPLVASEAVAVLDLASRGLLDGSGRALAHLDQVRVDKALQLTSSSRALKLSWPGGGLVVYRGDPFVLRGGGSIDAPATALAQRGVGVP